MARTGSDDFIVHSPGFTSLGHGVANLPSPHHTLPGNTSSSLVVPENWAHGGGVSGNVQSSVVRKMSHIPFSDVSGIRNSSRQPMRPDGGGPHHHGAGEVGCAKTGQHIQASSQPQSSHNASAPPLVLTTASIKEPTTDQVSGVVQVHSKVPLLPIFWCEICRIYCNKLEVLEQHKNGKRHKKTVKMYEEMKIRNMLLAEVEPKGTVFVSGHAYYQLNKPADYQSNVTEQIETVGKFVQAHDPPKTILESQSDVIDQQNKVIESHSDSTGQQGTITVSDCGVLDQQETMTKLQFDPTEQLLTTQQEIRKEHGIHENNLLDTCIKKNIVPEQPIHNVFKLSDDIRMEANSTEKSQEMLSGDAIGRKNLFKSKLIMNNPGAIGPQQLMFMPKRPKHQPQVCKVCNITCDTETVFMGHLAGKKHIAKAKRLFSDANSQRETAAECAAAAAQLDTITESGQGNTFASAKDHPLPDQPAQNVNELSQELGCGDAAGMQSSFKRKLNTNNPGVKKLRKSGPMLEHPKHQSQVCEVCNITCDTEAVFKCHLAGKKHVSKAKRLLSQSISHVPVCNYPAYHSHESQANSEIYRQQENPMDPSGQLVFSQVQQNITAEASSELNRISMQI